MPPRHKKWEITCDHKTFHEVRRVAQFPHIVALARCINALNTIHSIWTDSPSDTPAGVRNRMNSYFFASALLYEGLKLVGNMKHVFEDDQDFKNGLRLFYDSPHTQKFKQDHLHPGRNNAVFHFQPQEFKKAINKTADDRQVFVTGMGQKKGNLHYDFADILAAEVIVGMPSNDPDFQRVFESAARETAVLVSTFTNHAEKLIATHLKAWGFKREPGPCISSH